MKTSTTIYYSKMLDLERNPCHTFVVWRCGDGLVRAGDGGGAEGLLRVGEDPRQVQRLVLEVGGHPRHGEHLRAGPAVQLVITRLV